MIALDTNTLVRFITRDDTGQAARVERFLRTAKEGFFVSVPVLLELVWLLDRRFGYGRNEIVQVLRAFSERKDFAFEDESHVLAAISAFEDGGDFADHLILEAARAFGCSKLASLDTGFANRYPDFVIRP